jgi:pimeloyl-ACP methyl ester carboxylesterase
MTEAPSELTATTVKIDDAKLVVWRAVGAAASDAQPVVFLHPWFGCWQFWRPTISALPECEVYAVDLYSLGASSAWLKFSSPFGLARAVENMIDALQLSPCTIVGNSMGGIAAQIVASRRGREVEKLILVGTGARTAGLNPQWRRALDEWIAGVADREMTARLVGGLFARNQEPSGEFETYVQEVERANRDFMGAVLRRAFELDLRPILPRITSTTLVIRGEHDGARTPAHVAELLAGIPRSRAVEIPNAGHSPQVDSPEAFVRVLRDAVLG